MKAFLLLLFVIGSSFCHAQKVNSFIDSILQNRILKISAYQQNFISQESKLFNMQFGKSNFVDTTGIHQLNNTEILSIDLVFTDYPSNLDLKPLNKQRFLQLNKLLPNAINNKYTKWQIIRQMDGADKQTAKGMLHGFVINYRKPTTAADTKKEIDYIYALTPDPAEELEPVKKQVPKKKEKIRHWEIIHNMSNNYKIIAGRTVKKISNDKNEIVEEFEKGDSAFTLSTKKALQQQIITGRERDINVKLDSVFVLLDGLPKPFEEFVPKREKVKVLPKKDSTVIKIFERNKFKNMLVVADVTSSMSTYNAQIIFWLDSETKKNNLEALVCFNDGDDKQTEQKIIGNTGGIYGEIFKDVNQISELMQTVMEKGSGGDLPENDCEALIKSINQFNNYDDIILIADSWAPVRDIDLVTKITKPIKIIICGNELGPHADYVTIAMQTNGSLHLSDLDVTDFSLLKQNKILTIKGSNYMLKDGKVVNALR